MPKTRKITCENAEKILAEFLPTKGQMKSVWEFPPLGPGTPQDERHLIYWDETSVYAWLPIPGRYEWHKVSYWHLLQRAFMGSCSSSWSWGLWRMPNLKHDRTTVPDLYPNGPADTIEEAGLPLLKRAIKACLLRHKTGLPQSAGKLNLMIVELANCYQDGWSINPQSLSRLIALSRSRKELYQPGYEAVTLADDRLLILWEEEYLKYLWDHLAEFHQNCPINVGVSAGNIYYITEQHLVSDAINRLWLGMRAIVPGTIVYDLERLNWLPECRPLYGLHPEMPGSIHIGKLDFGHGHIRSPVGILNLK